MAQVLQLLCFDENQLEFIMLSLKKTFFIKTVYHLNEHVAYTRLLIASAFHVTLVFFLCPGLTVPLYADKPSCPENVFILLPDKPASRDSIAAAAGIQSALSGESNVVVKGSVLRGQYTWHIVSIVFSCILLILVAALFVERRRRMSVEKTLEDRLHFEEILEGLSRRFVNIPPEQVDLGIDEAMRMVCERFDFDIGVLWQWSSAEPRFLTITHLYRPLGGAPTPDRIDAEDMFPWCLRELRAGRVVVISTDEAPPEAARDQEVWRRYGIKSSTAFPLSLGGGPLIGVLGFNVTREKRFWPEDLVKGLELVAEIFANALTRKLSDQALRESEERLSIASASAGAGLWILDLGTGQFWATAKALELFGLAPDDALSLGRFLELVHPEDRGRVHQTLRQMSQSNDDTRITYRVIPGGNSIRWIVSRGRRQLGPSGEAQRLMGVSLDVTERMQMEKKIEAGAREWQVTFDSIPDMVMILDRDYRVIQANAAARSFLDLPFESILGNQSPVLVHSEDYPAGSCPFPKISEIKGHEERDIYDDLKQKWFHISVDPILNEEGQTVRVVHMVKDITAGKRAETEAFAARRELLRMERVLRMGELTASLAHELNQPLTSILSNARAGLRFIESGEIDIDEIKDILKDIANDDKRAGNIIRSLRSMVKPEEGERITVSLNDVLVEVISLFHSEAIIRNVNVETFFVDPLPQVSIDPVQIQQVVTNILMNAAESMLDESRNRKMLVRTQVIDGDKVRVAVSDYGPGIAEEDLGKIFEPFFTTKRSGLGMGLSLSRSIVEAHGGRIWVENNPDKGATFYFDLPVER